MYAVIKTGGKQYRVKEGDTLRVEKLAGDPGSKVTLDQVLMVGGIDAPKIGKPKVDGASVEAEIMAQDKHRKVLHFIKNYFGFTRRQGHRQAYTELKITSIRA